MTSSHSQAFGHCGCRSDHTHVCNGFFFVSGAKEAGDDRAGKIRKLGEVRQAMPFMSKSAMEALLKYVSKHGVPEATSAKDMRAANRELISSTSAYGPLLYEKQLTTVQGGIVRLFFVNFLTYLFQAYECGGGFYNALNQLLAAHSSLSIILYSDEVAPGNPLSTIVYAAIKEMAGLLSDVDAWATLFVAKSSVVGTLSGSISQMPKEILENTFRNPICNVEHLGLMLKGPPGKKVVNVKLTFACFVTRWCSNEIYSFCCQRRLWVQILHALQEHV